MTRTDLAELEQLLAAYRVSCVSGTMVNIARARRRLETALVRHADVLLAAAKACQALGQLDLHVCVSDTTAEWERAQLSKRDHTP